MITISTNKGLTKIEKWEDIQTRPGFLPDLNPTDHELDSIIGRYIFPEKIRCGLSNCHTLHTRGYIVSTKSGRETNIGKDCGKTYFGVDFELQARKFDRDITEAENRDLLWNFSFQLDEVESKIEALRKGDRGADWVNKNVQILKNPGRIPNEIVRRLATMAKTQSNVLMAAREATEKEIKRLEESEKRSIKRPYVIEEPIAEIAGIDALYPENDLRKLIVIDLEEELKSFKEQNIDTMSYEKLAYWKKWATSVDHTLEAAADAVAAGQRLLHPRNLIHFIKILEKEVDIQQFEAYIASIGRQ